MEEQGLKTHSKRKHTKVTVERKLNHLYKYVTYAIIYLTVKRNEKAPHSYKQIEYKYEECGFLGGAPHSDQFEYGLCEFVAKDLENPNMHLFTCEVYQCKECEKPFKIITDMIEHINNEHVINIQQLFIQNRAEQTLRKYPW